MTPAIWVWYSKATFGRGVAHKYAWKPPAPYPRLRKPWTRLPRSPVHDFLGSRWLRRNLACSMYCLHFSLQPEICRHYGLFCSCHFFSAERRLARRRSITGIFSLVCWADIKRFRRILEFRLWRAKWRRVSRSSGTVEPEARRTDRIASAVVRFSARRCFALSRRASHALIASARQADSPKWAITRCRTFPATRAVSTSWYTGFPLRDVFSRTNITCAGNLQALPPVSIPAGHVPIFRKNRSPNRTALECHTPPVCHAGVTIPAGHLPSDIRTGSRLRW